MKMRLDELMRYAPAENQPSFPACPERARRVKKLTKEKIRQAYPSHLRRPMVRFAIAALLIVALCGTAVAGYTHGWFSRLFRGTVAEDYVSDEPATVSGKAAQEGEFVPFAGKDEDFRVTVQGLLVSENAIVAGVQVDPLSERGESYLKQGVLTFRIYNDGRSFVPLTQPATTVDASVRYVLVISGKTATAGDTLLFAFHGLTPGTPACIIGETTVSDVLTGEKHFSLDPSVYDGDSIDYAYTSVSVTPLTLTVRNDDIASGEPESNVYNSRVHDENGDSFLIADGDYHPWIQMAAVTVTLKDGTTFPLPAKDPPTGASFGEYGAVLSGYSKASYTWTFTQPVSLDEIASITVDGKEYPMKKDDP